MASKQVAEAFSLLPTYPSGDSSHLYHDCPLLPRETEPAQGYMACLGLSKLQTPWQKQ